MDFQQLLAKMVELDRPVAEAAKVDECGGPMDMPPPMTPNMPTTPPPSHPSMSINLNAQGLDNIESIMKLMTKVNPDMISQKEPLTAIPHTADTEIEPATMPGMPLGPKSSSIGDLGDLDKGPLKMLPDLDADNDDMPGGEKDIDKDNMPPGDLDDDGEKEDEAVEPEGEDDDIMTHLNKELKPYDDQVAKDKEKDEAYANEPDEEIKSADYMNNQLAGGMNRPKGTFPKVAGGDNPMQRQNESGDLRAQIRAELLQRLAEAKGAK
jgi:hypothetical protein